MKFFQNSEFKIATKKNKLQTLQININRNNIRF